jgi:hypothetical protein
LEEGEGSTTTSAPKTGANYDEKAREGKSSFGRRTMDRRKPRGLAIMGKLGGKDGRGDRKRRHSRRGPIVAMASFCC